VSTDLLVINGPGVVARSGDAVLWAESTDLRRESLLAEVVAAMAHVSAGHRTPAEFTTWLIGELGGPRGSAVPALAFAQADGDDLLTVVHGWGRVTAPGGAVTATGSVIRIPATLPIAVGRADLAVLASGDSLLTLVEGSVPGGAALLLHRPAPVAVAPAAPAAPVAVPAPAPAPAPPAAPAPAMGAHAAPAAAPSVAVPLTTPPSAPPPPGPLHAAPAPQPAPAPAQAPAAAFPPAGRGAAPPRPVAAPAPAPAPPAPAPPAPGGAPSGLPTRTPGAAPAPNQPPPPGPAPAPAPAPAMAPAPAPAPMANPGSSGALLVSLRSGAADPGLAPREPLPIAQPRATAEGAPAGAPAPGAPGPLVPSSPRAAIVPGVNCSRQHFNNPSALYCRICGISMLQQTHVRVDGERPPLGVLVCDDGSTFGLDGDYAIGSDPSQEPGVTSGLAQPLVIGELADGVAPTHVVIHLDGWDVHALNRSPNAPAAVLNRGDTQWTPLPPGQWAKLAPGSYVGFAGRHVVFESNNRA